MCARVHALIEIGGQFCRVSSFHLRFQKLNSGCQGCITSVFTHWVISPACLFFFFIAALGSQKNRPLWRFSDIFILPPNVHSLPYYQHSVPGVTFVRTEKPTWIHYNHRSLWFVLGFTLVLNIWLGLHRCKMAGDHLVLTQNTFTAFREGACEYWLSQGFHLRAYYLGFHGRVLFDWHMI